MRLTGQQDITRRRSGLTIVELLAATVLAVLLVTAVLGVLRTVTQRQIPVGEDTAAESWHSRLEGQLHWDLTNSRSIRPIENGFELTGFAGRAFSGRGAVHCRANIRYELVKASGHSCLLRTEIHPDSQSRDNRLVELVCLNVGEIMVDAPGEEVSRESASEAGFRISAPEGELPSALRVALFHSSSTDPVFSHDFAIR